jgi:hypothetical protein
MTVKFTNNASTTVGTGINASATSLTVASASSFPSLSGADDYCYLTLQGATNTTREVVKATALSSNTFTIVRAQDNTSAASWVAGDIVELRMTAALLTDVIDAATVEGVKTNYQYTPTAGQTVFSGADNASATMIINQAALVSVYMNGVRLVQGTDYSVSSANNTVTLGIGATTADIIDIEVYGNFVGQSGAAVGITGGSITGTAITATTLGATGTATLNTLVSNNATISGGSLDGVTIGGTTRGAISGNAISGTSFASTGDMTFGDNDKAIFGIGNDLQIYHVGGNSYVLSNTGSLVLRSDSFRVLNTANSEQILHGDANGAVTAYYDNAVKLATTATGIDVTGTAVANGFTLGNNAEYINVKNSSGAATRAFGVNAGNNLYIGGIDADIGPILFVDNGATLATLGPTGLDVTGTVTANSLNVNNAGKIGFNIAGEYTLNSVPSPDFGFGYTVSTNPMSLSGYYGFAFATARIERMRIDGATGDVGIGTSSPSYNAKLDVNGIIRANVGSGGLSLSGNAAPDMSYVSYNYTNSNGTEVVPQSIRSSHRMSMGNGAQNAITFDYRAANAAAGTWQERMRIDGATGNVGIGVSPSRRLHVKDSGSFVATFEGGTNVYTSWSNSTGTAGYIGSANGLGSGGITDLAVRSENNLIFLTNAGSERMRLDASGKVGIGTSFPSNYNSAFNDLVVAGSGDSGITVVSGTSSEGSIAFADGTSGADAYRGWINYNHNSNFMRFSTNATERMRIDASGNVGIGVSNPSDYYANNLVVTGPSEGGITIASTGNHTNYINFADSTSGVARYAGMIEYAHTIDAMSFRTNSIQSMRLDASGNLLVGTTNTSQSAGDGIKIKPWGSVQVVNNSSTGGGDAFSYFSTAGNNYRFWVNANGQIASLSTSIYSLSDQRFKENIRDLDDGLSKVMQLKPRKFDWKEGRGTDTKDARGFIAQEFEEVFPDLIGEWKDPAPEGEEPYKSVSADLIPTLVKAIQEQQATIEALTARIAALES